MKILVIGETCIDKFVYGRCNRLCPEAPVPVFTPLYEVDNSGGMAKNVYQNLLNLGVDVTLLTQDLIKPPIKCRYVDEMSNHMFLRVDENDEVPLITIEQLNSIKYCEYDAIMIIDYDKGFLDVANIINITKNHSLVFLDTKKEIKYWANNIKYIKVNENEFQRSKKYLTENYPHNLIVTLGRDGALHYNTKKIVKPEKGVEVRDVAGAGDTFFAAFVVNLLKNDDIYQALCFANKCASWVVTQRGVVAIDLNKINN